MTSTSLANIVTSLSRFAIGASERESIIEQYQNETYLLSFVVESNMRTFELGLDAQYKKGRTLVGNVGKARVMVFFPEQKNQQMSVFKRGVQVEVSAKLHDWKSLQKQLIFLG